MPGRRRREDLDRDASPGPAEGSLTQRRRVANGAAEDSDDGVMSDDAETQAEGLDEPVKKLIRLALACEYQRRPIRRAEINEKVLGANNRKFKAVWSQAQMELKNVFGMEMVELPAREKITLQQRRAAQKTPTQAKATVSWITVNILPSELRDPVILRPTAAPTSTEESKYIGIYTLLISLISLSGGSLPDAKLERCLARLQMEDRTPLADYDRTERLMKRLEKDGYITQVKESAGPGEDDIYWIVGPRGRVEVGDNGVRGLTKSVFGDMATEAEEDDLERKIARSLGLGERAATKSASQPTAKRRGRPRREADDDEDGQDEEEGNDEDD